MSNSALINTHTQQMFLQALNGMDDGYGNILTDIVGAISGTPELKLGDKGSSVTKLQNMLKAAGFDPGLINGVFGASTEAAVKSFQFAKVPSNSGTGVVDKATWAALAEFKAPSVSGESGGSGAVDMVKNLIMSFMGGGQAASTTAAPVVEEEEGLPTWVWIVGGVVVLGVVGGGLYYMTSSSDHKE